MRPTVLKLVKRAALLAVIVVATLLAGRAWQSQQGDPLQVWHKHIPPEMNAREIAALDWKGYLARESAIFEDVRVNVTQLLPVEDRVPSNRYFADSPIYPGRFATDWNRSYVLEPVGKPIGAVVLLHGLTDSPYSLRHVARRYQDDGFVAVAIRLPGHGTVPAGLVDVVGSMVRSNTPCCARGATQGRAGSPVAHRRVQQRRCACDEVRARRAGR